MKKIRITLLLAALGFFTLVVYQNMAYFLTPARLQMDFWVTSPVVSDRIINAQLILGAFFAGLLTAYFWSLSFRFKCNQSVKSLNATVNSQMETITSLRSELSQYQGSTLQADPPQSEVPAENT